MENYGSMIEQVYLGSPNNSAFDRSHHNYLTGKLGTIIPTRIDEVYPADRIKGHVQGVLNFEPLVAPIMGNMRYKQESFYVPDSILWKDAHKFYTGKKGFNEARPSVSPREVFNAYGNVQILQNRRTLLPFPILTEYEPVRGNFLHFLVHCKPLSTFWSDPQEHYADVLGMSEFSIIRNSLVSFGELYQVLDLLQPLIDLIDDYFLKKNDAGSWDNLMFNQIMADLSAHYISIDNVSKILCQFMYEYYSYIFGPSSLMDYMGFPIFTDWQKLFMNDVFEWTCKYITDDIPDLDYSFPEPPYGNLVDLFSDISLNWLPWRAAYVCWYWNYRDELLETQAFDPESDTFLSGHVTNNEMILLTLIRYRCWFKDTFTTALTNTGDGNLSVPIIKSGEFADSTYEYYDDFGNTMQNVHNLDEALQAGVSVFGINIGNLSYRVPMNYFSQQNIIGTSVVSNSDTLSLDLFERIKRLQKFVQKKLVLGYEYDDVVWSSFLVKLSNVRMRIPEILGRGSDLVELNTIVNNTNTAEQIAGDRTAIAWAQGRQSDINYFAEEHGYFISFMTVLPIQSYTGGMQRMWLKREQFDVFWPEFAAMGMDAVYNCELSAPAGEGALHQSKGLTDEQSMSVFGYQGRYYDLKSRLDEEHGRVRTDLNYLTFARHFNSENLPKLNYIFVHCHPNLDMFVMNDPKQDLFRGDIFHALDFERRLQIPSEYI